MTSRSSRTLRDRAHALPPAGLGLAALALLLGLGGCQVPEPAKPPAQTQAAAPQPQPEPEPEPEPLPRADSFEPAPDLLDPTVKVALLAPLSGSHAGVGESLVNAAQLALFDLAGDDFELIVRDTGGTPQGAAAAADTALSEGARLIVGPLFSEATAAVAPVAGAAGISVISFSNDRSVAAPGVYIMGITPDAQVTRVVDYAVDQGHFRYAALTPETPFGRLTLRALQEAVTARGAELVRIATYSPVAEDLTEDIRRLADYDARAAELERQRAALRAKGDQASQLALRRLRGLDTIGDPGFDAILIPEGGNRLREIGPLLAFYDVDPREVQFLGTALWYDASLAAEPTLRGGWFAAPPLDQWRNFSDRYARLFGAAPPRVAALGYDAAALAAVLARRAGEQGERLVYDAELLTRDSGFSGVDGIFRFRADGSNERGLGVLELQRDDFVVRDPAPESFAPLIN